MFDKPTSNKVNLPVVPINRGPMGQPKPGKKPKGPEIAEHKKGKPHETNNDYSKKKEHIASKHDGLVKSSGKSKRASTGRKTRTTNKRKKRSTPNNASVGVDNEISAVDAFLRSMVEGEPQAVLGGQQVLDLINAAPPPPPKPKDHMGPGRRVPVRRSL